MLNYRRIHNWHQTNSSQINESSEEEFIKSISIKENRISKADGVENSRESDHIKVLCNDGVKDRKREADDLELQLQVEILL